MASGFCKFLVCCYYSVVVSGIFLIIAIPTTLTILNWLAAFTEGQIDCSSYQAGYVYAFHLTVMIQLCLAYLLFLHWVMKSNMGDYKLSTYRSIITMAFADYMMILNGACLPLLVVTAMAQRNCPQIRSSVKGLYWTTCIALSILEILLILKVIIGGDCNLKEIGRNGFYRIFEVFGEEKNLKEIQKKDICANGYREMEIVAAKVRNFTVTRANLRSILELYRNRHYFGKNYRLIKYGTDTKFGGNLLSSWKPLWYIFCANYLKVHKGERVELNKTKEKHRSTVRAPNKLKLGIVSPNPTIILDSPQLLNEHDPLLKKSIEKSKDICIHCNDTISTSSLSFTLPCVNRCKSHFSCGRLFIAIDNVCCICSIDGQNVSMIDMLMTMII